MGMIAAAYRHMVAAGMSPEAIEVAIADMEVTSTPRQERNRRYYEKRKAGSEASESVLKRLNDSRQTSVLKASESVLIKTPLARVEDNLLLKEDTGKKKERKNLGASVLNSDAPSQDPFLEFWTAYPRRDGSNPKKPAKLKFERAVSRGADPAKLIAAAKRLRAEHPSPTPFVPQAVTWLNQERWDEDGTGPPEPARFKSVEEVIAEVAAEKAAMNGHNPEDLPDDRREFAGSDVRQEVRH